MAVPEDFPGTQQLLPEIQARCLQTRPELLQPVQTLDSKLETREEVLSWHDSVDDSIDICETVLI